MAWFSGKVSLGGFPDLAGAVNKLQESVKNIEKSFDNALGFEENSESSSNEDSGLWSPDRKALFDPVMALMGQKGEETAVESSKNPPEVVEKEEAETDSSTQSHEKTTLEDDKQDVQFEKDNKHSEAVERADSVISDPGKAEPESETEAVSPEPSQTTLQNVESLDSLDREQQKQSIDMVISEGSDSKEVELDSAEVDHVEDAEPVPSKSTDALDIHESKDDQRSQMEEILEKSSVKSEESSDRLGAGGGSPEESAPPSSHSISVEETNSVQECPSLIVLPSFEDEVAVSESVFVENDSNTERVEVGEQTIDGETDVKELHLSSATIMPASTDSTHELEKVRMEMKMMESALQGAAKQAQAKADEIAKLMNESEQLKAVIQDLKCLLLCTD